MDVKRALTALTTSALFLAAPLGSGLSPAYAHDVVVRSAPADGSTIQQAPDQLELEFSGIPKDTFNTVALSKEDTGEVLFSADPRLENQIIRVDVPKDITLKPGKYKIGFQITSSDGHATRGMTTFTLAGEASEVPTKEDMVASSSEAPYSNQQFLYMVIGGILTVIALVVGIVLAVSRRNK